MEKKKWIAPTLTEAWGEDTESGRNASLIEGGTRIS